MYKSRIAIDLVVSEIYISIQDSYRFGRVSEIYISIQDSYRLGRVSEIYI